MTNKGNLDPNKIKINEKSNKNILICYIEGVAVKNLSYPKINCVNSSYLIINKINVCIKENKGNKYLTLVLTTEIKNTFKKSKELWNKTTDLVRLITNNSNNYDEKNIKFKFNSDDDLPLKKMLDLYNMIIVLRSVFHKGNKYYPQVS